MSGRSPSSGQSPLALPKLTPVQQIVSASSGAMLVSFFTTPFDVIKVRLQAHQKGAASVSSSSVRNLCEVCFCELGAAAVAAPAAAPAAPAAPAVNVTLPHVQNKRYGSLQMVKTIAIGEGPQHLWRGLSASLAMAIPATVIYYTAYDLMLEHSGFHKNRSNPIPPILCGSSARTIAVAAICPIEMIRTKMQSQSLGSHKRIRTVLKQAIEVDGVWSLWRGFYPMLWRDVPFSAIYWWSYEMIKSRAVNQGRNITTFEAFTAGATAGSAAAILTNPFDVVKTYWQVEVGERRCQAVPPHRLPRVSMISLMKKILNDHGVRGLFVGLVPRVSKIAPACAIMISSYEFCKAFFRSYSSRP